MAVSTISNSLQSQIDSLNSNLTRLDPTQLAWRTDNVDCNNYMTTGMYNLANPSNSPASWILLLVFAPRNDYVCQIAVNSLMWFREYRSGSWSSWKSLVNNS